MSSRPFLSLPINVYVSFALIVFVRVRVLCMCGLWVPSAFVADKLDYCLNIIGLLFRLILRTKRMEYIEFLKRVTRHRLKFFI